jgi:hypothetical protein
MDEQNLPENTASNNTRKNKIIKIVALIIAVAASLVFLIERLFSDFTPTDPIGNNNEVITEQTVSLEGIIKYIPPEIYEADEIGFELTDKNGKTLVLLKAEDDILQVAENLDVTVRGTMDKTLENEDVLLVEEIVISQ